MTVSWRNSCLQPETAFLLLRPVHWINLQGQQKAGGPRPSRLTKARGGRFRPFLLQCNGRDRRVRAGKLKWPVCPEDGTSFLTVGIIRPGSPERLAGLRHRTGRRGQALHGANQTITPRRNKERHRDLRGSPRHKDPRRGRCCEQSSHRDCQPLQPRSTHALRPTGRMYRARFDRRASV
jgi:hypothetical protein